MSSGFPVLDSVANCVMTNEGCMKRFDRNCFNLCAHLDGCTVSGTVATRSGGGWMPTKEINFKVL